MRINKKYVLSLVLAIILTIPASVYARGHGGSSHSHSSSSSYYHSSYSHHSRTSYKSHHHTKNYCSSCSRDSHGHIKRSLKAKEAFRKSHPCPSTGKTSGRCPGYVIDHIQALKHGGADSPSNMQWQTKEAAQEKDKWE